MRRREVTNIALELLRDKLQETKVLLAAERCNRVEAEDACTRAWEEVRLTRTDLNKMTGLRDEAISQRNSVGEYGKKQLEQYMRKLREIEAVIRLNNPNALDTLDTVMGIVRQAIENKEVSF